MPVRSANSFWLYPCNSRMMRTDSPTETLMRFLAGRKVFISYSPILMRCNMDHPKQGLLGDHLVDHPVLQSQAGQSIPLPLSMEDFVVEPFDQSQPRWPRN